MEILPISSPTIKIGDDLFDIFCRALKKCSEKIGENSIIVIASKVVSVSEKRIIDLQKIKPGKHAKALNFKRYSAYKPDPRFTELVIREADKFYKDEMFLTIKDGIFAPSAGIDTSNIQENFAVLWPKNSYKSAEEFLKKIKNNFGVKNCGVIISDSFITPLRAGVTAIAIGYAGFEGVKNMRGKRDLFGKKLKTTSKNIADAFACSASVYIGEANEKIPFALIKNAPAKFTNKKPNAKEIKIPAKKCLYKALY
ncbi:MAG: coenzyme F420-0:L-glutamate ligase [Candidatus Gracilibacteria bacterium]